jgi:hypothetical protein
MNEIKRLMSGRPKDLPRVFDDARLRNGIKPRGNQKECAAA